LYDFLIVGAGLFGATMARELTDAGKTCLVVEKRNHIAGNCYDEPQPGGYHVVRYGGHIFHTQSEGIWNYVNRFTPFKQYHHKVRSRVDDTIYSFPINLLTLHQLWGVTTPAEARRALEERRVSVPDRNANMEAWCLSTIGTELYETFIKGYTTKQWGRSPSTLPASIVRRIPVRLTYDDSYYDSAYQGMPDLGYTSLVRGLLDGIEVQLEVDYLARREQLNALANHVIYSGPVDAFYEYRYGQLAYRSLSFDWHTHEGDYQGSPTINYPSLDRPYTRDVEFQHFFGGGAPLSIWMRETPQAEGEPYYPVRDAENVERYNKYAALADKRTTVGGRLGAYTYQDMAPTIAQAMMTAKRLLKGNT
jgi:UDP-galactopyranose mutase